MKLIRRKLIRLHAIRKIHHMHFEHSAPQPISDFCCGGLSCVIAIEHYDDMREVFRKEILLQAAHDRTHERNAWEARLRHQHAIEESFYEDHRQLPSHAMQIEELE